MSKLDAASAVTTVAAPVSRLLRESGRYLLVSMAALILDYSLLICLAEFAHLNYLLSAGIGFTAGLILNYGLSITFVFDEHRLANPAIEFLGFAVIGLIGLGLNVLMMKLIVDHGHLGYAVAKIPATAIGFLFNFGARRAILFTR